MYGYKKCCKPDQKLKISGHCHGDGSSGPEDTASQLRRYRVVAQVLELRIVVHSIMIGLSMGASDNLCTIKPLVVAVCFHQFFEVTTPFGIAVGIGLSNVYRENSPTALIVVGVLNTVSVGLFNYMALVDLLALDFMGIKLKDDMKLQAFAYVAVNLGAGGM
ncbi:fe(2+) transport protein 1-like isoform X2 [Rutidosis leptorrhynchoides]|uniref:fe(2+) transport protein 1-like isoform X1 n=1 Tax=Rutidosis leptorrhynchoides TaxID=125765 RepID=UPI003A9A51B1